MFFLTNGSQLIRILVYSFIYAIIGWEFDMTSDYNIMPSKHDDFGQIIDNIFINY